jgi:hypothetical protein
MRDPERLHLPERETLTILIYQISMENKTTTA